MGILSKWVGIWLSKLRLGSLTLKKDLNSLGTKRLSKYAVVRACVRVCVHARALVSAYVCACVNLMT